jgi:hypothetical protein
MPFNISEYKQHIGQFGALPTNKFFVNIPMPRVMSNAQMLVNNTRIPLPTLGKLIEFRAESVRAPGVAIGLTQNNRYGIGPIQKYPNNANFTDTSITFLADTQNIVWSFFYTWLNNVFSFEEKTPRNYGSASSGNYSTYRSNYRMDYSVPIFIYIYDQTGNTYTTVQLADAFPVNMNDIDLSWAETNQLMRITVTFAFRDWQIMNTTQQDASSQAGVPYRLSIPSHSG